LEPDENDGNMIITCLYASPGMKRLNGKILISDCFFFEELTKGNVVVIEDTTASPVKSSCGWIVASDDIRSELLCPIIAGEHIICIISLQRNIVYQWSKQEILDIQKIALSLYRHIRSYEHLAFRSHLLDAVNDAIAVLDGNGCINFWNVAAERMSGYSAFEAKGMPIGTLLKLDQSSTAYIAAIKSLNESNYCAVEITCCHKNGQRIHVEALGKVYRNEKGEVLETILSLRDITQRQNMILALKQQADSLAQRDRLLELSGEAIIIWQLDGVITYWNGKAELLYGISARKR
jgi:PAS domain S-box-containing protein